jgi:hypothetical protein
LYLTPPENAIVLSVDEKSQIQALDRTQKMLPMQPGKPEKRIQGLRPARHHHIVRRPEIATDPVIRSISRPQPP